MGWVLLFLRTATPPASAQWDKSFCLHGWDFGPSFLGLMTEEMCRGNYICLLGNGAASLIPGAKTVQI